MSLYRQMAKTAVEMLSRFGQAATFERPVPGAYDTASGQMGEAGVRRWRLAAVRDMDARTEAGGALVGAEELRLLVAAGGVAPAVGDAVSLADGTRGAVKAVAPFNPAGEALYYTVTVRR